MGWTFSPLWFIPLTLAILGFIFALIRWMIDREVKRFDAAQMVVSGFPGTYLSRAEHVATTQRLEAKVDQMAMERQRAHELVLAEIRESRRECSQQMTALRGEVQEANRRVDHIHQQSR